jgi:hypothetical protein
MQRQIFKAANCVWKREEGPRNRKRGARCPDGSPRVVTNVCTRSIACYKARKQYKIREDEIRVESRLDGASIP